MLEVTDGCCVVPGDVSWVELNDIDSRGLRIVLISGFERTIRFDNHIQARNAYNRLVDAVTEANAEPEEIEGNDDF